MEDKNLIGFIDITKVNCWMVYLMPFGADERTDYDRVNTLQQECIKLGIFGMGWAIPCFECLTLMTPKNIEIYAKAYKDKYDGKWSVSEDALNGYQSIKKGDYVIMRLKNGHYYIGRVSSEGAKYIYKEGDPVYGLFSWGGTVEKWFEYSNDQEIPSEIVGRFSQRLHSTIQRIVPYRQRLLVISMYERKSGEKRFKIPKLRIGLNNFVRSLNYMELEDLVALYIMDKHNKDGYKLIPSSCKVSQQNYEFSFVAKGKKPITCQVKNQHEIDIERYKKDKSYEKIYIFSGRWNEKEVLSKRELYKDYGNIYIISPSELYRTLKEEGIFKNDFYDFENTPISPYNINLDGYEKKKKPKGENTYSIDDDYICFVNGDGLFYSAEFGLLVHSWDVFEGTKYDRNCIEKIKADINR